MIDFIRVKGNQTSYPTIYNEPGYVFRKEGEFHYSLVIKDASSDNIICELFFMEHDLHEFIMKAEMSSRLK